MLTIALATAFLFSPAAFGADRGTHEAEHGVWLGVQLAPVPDSLAAHLQLTDTGLMVRNVFKDSPADQVGIERCDVIVEADGEKVAGDANAFIRYVGDKKPGDSLELDVYHKGRKTHMKVTLTKRPRDWDELERKYADEQNWSPWGDFRGRILRRGPDGWILEDLGPMPDWRDLPRELHGRLDDWFSRLDDIDEGRRVDRKGKVLHVRRNEDGTVVVKRYLQRDGERKAETKTYDNVEALESDDPEAYELLQSARRERRILREPEDWLDRPWFHRFRDRTDDVYDKWRQQREKYNEAFKHWRKRMRESLPAEKWEQWREWSDRFFQGPLKELEPPAFDPEECDALPSTRPSPEPRVRFETQPDGKIIVHLRKGDAELSRPFQSEDDLEKDAPELYEQYQSLQERIR